MTSSVNERNEATHPSGVSLTSPSSENSANANPPNGGYRQFEAITSAEKKDPNIRERIEGYIADDEVLRKKIEFLNRVISEQTGSFE